MKLLKLVFMGVFFSIYYSNKNHWVHEGSELSCYLRRKITAYLNYETLRLCFHAGMCSLKAMLKYADMVAISCPDLTVFRSDIRNIETMCKELPDLRKHRQVRERLTKYLIFPTFIC